jgi:hypothetical protein
MAKRRKAATKKKTTRPRPRAGRKAKLTKAAPCHFVIVGLVTDKNSGVPLNNAMVKCVGGPGNFGKTAHTNILGLYLIPNICPERTLIEASLPGRVLEKDKTITGHTIINFAI